MSDNTVFDCRKCGSCCMGEGGIVLGPKDLARLCEHFGMDEKPFLSQYAELHNGKHKIRTGPDGNCIFFRTGKGCCVHEFKPDVCRAWPFFRGNMVDAASLDMAREFCPGIGKKVTHQDFVAEGTAYLREHGLVAQGLPGEATALTKAD